MIGILEVEFLSKQKIKSNMYIDIFLSIFIIGYDDRLHIRKFD